jgi:SAM-dependent methyltransferase
VSAAPAELYDDVLLCGGGLRLRTRRSLVVLDVERWRRPADVADQELVTRCRGPVLDVGCGPGRIVTALALRGVPALGVDVAPTAVTLARSTGALALHRDVFARLPLEGRWGEVLLVDGNVGIGGNVPLLLGRVAALLRPGGEALVEVDPDDDADEVVAARLEDDAGRCSGPFRWARVGSHALVRHAGAFGLQDSERWSTGGRAFVALRASAEPSRVSGHVDGVLA